MTIKDTLLEPYYIEVTDSSYDLMKDTGRKDKEDRPVTEVKGYYTKLSSAIHHVVRLKMGEDASVVSLGHFCKKYDKTYNQFLKICKQ